MQNSSNQLDDLTDLREKLFSLSLEELADMSLDDTSFDLVDDDSEEDDEENVQTRPHNPYQRRRDPRTKELYYVHRAIAEWKLGRPLIKGEVVHHDNGDKQDNHPENVWVFSCQRAHMLYENYRLREQGGIGHLFEIEDILEREGLWVVR